MVAKTAVADLRCVVDFSPPAFDLATRATEVLRALYNRISPHYPIDLADMRASGGPAISDVAASATMFGGSADVRVSAQDMTLTFRHIRGKQDVDICANIMSVSEQAVADSLPRARAHNKLLSCTLSLELGDGGADARDHVSHIVAIKRQLVVGDFDGGVCQPLINLEAVNQEAGWRATFHAAPHREYNSMLVAGCSVEYAFNHTAAANVEHVRQLMDAFLNVVGLEVDSLWSTTS